MRPTVLAVLMGLVAITTAATIRRYRYIPPRYEDYEDTEPSSSPATRPKTPATATEAPSQTRSPDLRAPDTEAPPRRAGAKKPAPQPEPEPDPQEEESEMEVDVNPDIPRGQGQRGQDNGEDTGSRTGSSSGSCIQDTVPQFGTDPGYQFTRSQGPQFSQGPGGDPDYAYGSLPFGSPSHGMGFQHMHPGVSMGFNPHRRTGAPTVKPPCSGFDCFGSWTTDQGSNWDRWKQALPIQRHMNPFSSSIERFVPDQNRRFYPMK